MRTFWASPLVVAGILASTSLQASSGMEEYFYSSGKIQVVVAVAATVMIGLIISVFRVDRKVTELEKKLTDKY